ncbi:MAG: hypothetical protein ACLQJR_17115 [Stellaceae bacterium]
MTVAMELSVAAEWRHRVAELRDVAERTEDPYLRHKLFTLADRWELFAEELREATGES